LLPGGVFLRRRTLSPSAILAQWPVMEFRRMPGTVTRDLRSHPPTFSVWNSVPRAGG